MQSPADVPNYAAQAVRYVQTSLGVELDYTHETLPLLDHYLGQIGIKDAVAPLIAETGGAYFGELIRRSFGGDWETSEDRLWFRPLPAFRLCPQDVVWSAIAAADNGPHHQFRLDVAPRYQNAVEALLRAMAPQSEEVYYSLCGRYDVLAHMVSVLQNESPN